MGTFRGRRLSRAVAKLTPTAGAPFLLGAVAGFYSATEEHRSMIEQATLADRHAPREAEADGELNEAALRKLPRDERIAKVREQHRRSVQRGKGYDGHAPGVEYR